jgi:hypothetical protein
MPRSSIGTATGTFHRRQHQRWSALIADHPVSHAFQPGTEPPTGVTLLLINNSSRSQRAIQSDVAESRHNPG